ncbi:hypothetical protein FIBSPDRAFT_861215 [Athelia psychrophila]|uniref:Uncharacterized protein n=1 Tax=Athelia psychrophila TaxID=1759441 RepID=A0A166JEL4_9AGAM|nr:hypothetical protein FIBSPDRAFT_861215 [Fibularhizoctonia sp. CBS 109695]
MSSNHLSAFDPFATHPFTNNSGLVSRPAKPAQYQAHPSRAPHSAPTPAQAAPQPRRPPHAKPTGPLPTQPIFVPFRQDNSSPDLDAILKKRGRGHGASYDSASSSGSSSGSRTP